VLAGRVVPAPDDRPYAVDGVLAEATGDVVELRLDVEVAS
jgi:hypothetical protein